jgi:hypothetical protein
MYNLPSSTIVNKVIPKKTFIDQLCANTRMKDHFTNDIIKVEWIAKLAPSTLNVTDGKEVHEISVFVVPIKSQDCPNDIFTFIDSMIPRHTLFILRWNNLSCLHLNYKERIKDNTNSPKTFSIMKTYHSSWTDNETLQLSINGLTMDVIYESLVRQVAGGQIVKQSNDLRNDVEISTEREELLKQLEILKKKEASEKQPQKKFKLHKQIIELKNKI